MCLILFQLFTADQNILTVLQVHNQVKKKLVGPTRQSIKILCRLRMNPNLNYLLCLLVNLAEQNKTEYYEKFVTWEAIWIPVILANRLPITMESMRKKMLRVENGQCHLRKNGLITLGSLLDLAADFLLMQLIME